VTEYELASLQRAFSIEPRDASRVTPRDTPQRHTPAPGWKPPYDKVPAAQFLALIFSSEHRKKSDDEFRSDVQGIRDIADRLQAEYGGDPVNWSNDWDDGDEDGEDS